MDAAVRYWSRATLRRNLRGAALLILLLAIGAGGSMAAAAGARRSQSAFHRVAARSNPPDAFVFAEEDGAFSKAIHLPQVAAVLSQYGLPLQPAHVACTDGDASTYFPIWAAGIGTPYGAVDRPRVMAGRLPDQSNPNEIALSEQHARRLRLGVGDRLRFKQYDMDEDPSDGCLPEIVAEVRVVGIVRHLNELGAREFDPTWTYVTRAFAERHDDIPHLFDNQAMVRLRNPSRDLTAFTRAAADAGAQVQPLGVFTRGGSVQPALDAIAIGLWAVAAVLALVTTTAVGVAFARQTADLEGDMRVLSAIGLRGRRAVVAAASPLVLITIVGTALAALLSVALSRVHLIGLAARVEPDPGIDVDVRVLLLGTAAALVVAVGLATWNAWRSTRAATRVAMAQTSRPGLVSRLQAAGAPPWLSMGASYALVRGSPRSPLPNRLATGAAAIGATGVIAVLLFGGALQHAQADPSTYGRGTWDGWAAGNGNTSALAALSGDADVVALGEVRPYYALTLNRRAVVGIEIENVRGTTGPSLVAGRFPIAPDEIALAKDTADEIGAHVGGTVTTEGARRSRTLRVVGLSAFPAYDGDPLAQGFLVLRSGTAALGSPDECNSQDCFENTAVRWRDGTDVDAKAAALSNQGIDLAQPDSGAEVRRLREVDRLPRALAVAIGVVAGIGVAHTLAATVVRRRRELAVARLLGVTRRQIRRVVLVQGLVLGLVSAAIGGVAGVVVGRLAWATASDAIGISRALPTAVITMTTALAAMVVLPVVLAVVPSFAAVRTRPAAGLREEQ